MCNSRVPKRLMILPSYGKEILKTYINYHGRSTIPKEFFYEGCGKDCLLQWIYFNQISKEIPIELTYPGYEIDVFKYKAKND